MRVLLFSLVTLLFSFSPQLHAIEKPQITIATGLSMPPYIIEGGNRGLLAEIILSSMKAANLNARLTFRSNLQAIDDFSHFRVDAVINATAEAFPSSYLSEVVIEFKNRAISLNKNNYSITHIDDLLNHSLIAFNAANKLLGTEFAQLAAQHENYQELVEQKQQVNALLSGRVDTIVADELIFKFYRSQLAREDFSNTDLKQKVAFHPVFPITQYRVAFHDQIIRNRFNEGFRAIKANGILEKIHNRYRSLLENHLF